MRLNIYLCASRWKQYGDLIPYHLEQQEYRANLTNLSETLIYSVRVYVVNLVGEVVAVSDEFSVGSSESSVSCAGTSGIPRNIKTYVKTKTSVIITWDHPVCDESYGPIEGYEYVIWRPNLGEVSDHKPPSFTSSNRVTIDHLNAGEKFQFKVRSRSRFGYSPWSTVFHGATKELSSREEGNIYNLRIILSTPKSYLVWTPLPEHKGHVNLVRLSYKVSTIDQWQKVEDVPEKFRCPEEINAGADDYCFDLSYLQFGIQYTADVIYRLSNGQWSKKGNPLFFILVEAVITNVPGLIKIPEAPARLTVRMISDRTAEVSWLPPLSDVKIDEYVITFIILNSKNAQAVPGKQVTFKTPGNVYTYAMDQLLPNTVYNVSVTAHSGNYIGPCIWEIFGKSGTFTISWEVTDPAPNLCCYQVDARSDKDQDWHPVSSPVNHVPNQYSYSTDLVGLEPNTYYHIRIRAISFENYATVFTSPSVGLTSQCQAPTAPPSDIVLNSVDSKTVLMSWNHPAKATWGCSDIFYNVEGFANSEPQSFHVQTDLRGFRVEHRIATKPGTHWRLRVQTANMNGVSPWSADYETRTEPDVYISTPTISYPGNRVQVDWRSQSAGIDNVVAYIVEYRDPSTMQWRETGVPIVYRGDNLLYTALLDDLRITAAVAIRVKVLDRNRNTLYVSPEVSAQLRCLAPVRPPTALTLSTPDSRHVRVLWQPPPKDSWMCNEISYELESLEPTRNSYPLPGETTSHIVDAQPNQNWSFRIRTSNTAGSSPWSRTIVTKTPTAGTLISDINIVYQREVPVMVWRSVEGVDDLVAGYIVKIFNERQPQWVPYKKEMASIPYVGWQRPYNLPLTDLPEGTKADLKPLTSAEWNCANGWYKVKYSSSAEQGFRNYSMTESSATFPSPPFTSWTFQVQAVNEAGSSPWSPEYTGTTEAGQCEEAPQPEVTRTNFEPYITLNSLYPNSRYKFTVMAETTIPGEIVSKEIITDQSVPTASPQAFQATEVSDKRILLQWQAPPCIHTNGEISDYEYELIGVDNWATGDSHIHRTPYTRAEINGLKPFTNYRGRVRAYTSAGPGPWSPYITIQTDSSAEPTAPPFVRVIGTTADSVELMWQGPYPPQGQIDQFKVNHAIGGTGLWSVNEHPAYQLHCTKKVEDRWKSQVPYNVSLYCIKISGLQPEKLYDFQVAGHISGKNWGPWSNVESVTTGLGSVKILNLVKQDATDRSIQIGWNIRPQDRVRIRGFRIIAHPVTDLTNIRHYTVDGLVTQYRIDDLLENTLYNISIQSKTDSAYEDGTSIQVKTEDAELPQFEVAPVVTQRTSDSVSLQWISPVNARNIAGYNIEYKVGKEEGWKQHGSMVAHVPGQNRYYSTIGRLPPYTDISLRIIPIDHNHRLGTPSQEISDRTLCAGFIIIKNACNDPRYGYLARAWCQAPSLAPENLRFDTVDQNEVVLKWQKPSEYSWNCENVNFDIAYRTSTNPQEKIVHAYGKQSEYVFHTSPHTQWYAKMRTTNKIGTSSWSNEVSVMTKEGAPGRVGALTLVPLSPNEVKVMWQPPVEKRGVITGYDVSYRLKYQLACPDEEPQGVTQNWITVYNVKDMDYVLSGLLPFSEYDVKVRARTSEPGEEEMNVVRTHQQPPSSAPLNLKTSFVLERTLGFIWQPVPCSERHGNIVGYEYELSGLDDWAKLDVRRANTTQTKVEIEDLTPFTKYSMRVKAFNNVGGGPPTTDVEVMTTKADAPLPPQDLSVMSEGMDFISISWIPAYPPYGPVESYRVRYQQVGATDPSKSVWNIDELLVYDPRLKCHRGGFQADFARLCFNVSQLESGKSYRIQVAGKIKDGSYGPWSVHTIGNTLVSLPGAPTLLTLLEKTDTSMKVSWHPPEDPSHVITGYKVTADVMSQRPMVRKLTKSLTVNSSTTVLLLENLEPDTAYNVTVQAMTNRGYGSGVWTVYSTDPAVIPSLSAPPVITDREPDSITLQWDPITSLMQSRVVGYLLEYRKYDESAWQEYNGIVKHDSMKMKYTDRVTGLSPDTPYLFRIKVIDVKNNVGEPSPSVDGRTSCRAPTIPPSNIGINALSPTQIRVTWQPPPSSSWLCSSLSYVLRYRNCKSVDVNDVEVMSPSNEHTVTSPPYCKWSVQVKSVNSAGSSDWSEAVSIVTPESAPSEVRNVTGEAYGSDQIKVTWRQPSDPNGAITGYTVSYRLKAKDFCPSQTQKQREQFVVGESVLLEGLEPASTYEIVVRAKTTTDGAESIPIYVTTSEAVPTGSPQNIRVHSTDKTSATFVWDEPSCEHKNGQINLYEYVVNSLDPWVRDEMKGHSSTNRIELNDLVPFTRYALRLRALNSKGAGPLSSPVVATTKSAGKT
ncbi:unnamed protein product [Soboliphyme baturini]|uniref:Phosphatidylinositol phosphatase PTPRQ n=1 Tax=Soboliphyme baturini TaxID=241478 RepID=A0A183IK58_9BILA|nr:unnamed protein product [Soboliphyme baturini]